MATTATSKKTSKKQQAPSVELVWGHGNRNTEDELSQLKIYKLVKENPRREGTHGYNSFAVLKNGMTMAKALAAGARMRDLRWDILRGRIEVR